MEEVDRLERAQHSGAGLVGDDSRMRQDREEEGMTEEDISDLQNGLQNNRRILAGEEEVQEEERIRNRRRLLDILDLGSRTC
jgi:hypothetical protein